MVDVIQHASAGPIASSTSRRVLRTVAPAVLVGLFTVLAAEWTWWLHPHGWLTGAASPGAGVLLGALLLLAPRRWPGPLLASALAVGLVAARHDAGVSLSAGRAIATVAAAVATALLLRWYAGGSFRLLRVRELAALLAAARAIQSNKARQITNPRAIMF